MGWFDERFFFSPEDIALSRKLNKNGYQCYVNSNVTIVHFEGMTGKGISKLQVATKPASYLGNLIFYGEDNRAKYLFVSILFFILLIPQLLVHILKCVCGNNKERNQILAQANINCLKIAFSSITPKDAFLRFSKNLL